ncbi:MAG: sulfite exporter TauE/SafE family protein, partial [Thermoprotei archaeon]
GAKLAVKSPPWLLRLIYAISIIIVGLYVAYEALVKL